MVRLTRGARHRTKHLCKSGVFWYGFTDFRLFVSRRWVLKLQNYLGEIALAASALGLSALLLAGALVLSDDYATEHTSSDFSTPAKLSVPTAGDPAINSSPGSSLAPQQDDRRGRTATTTEREATDQEAESVSDEDSNEVAESPTTTVAQSSSEIPDGWVVHRNEGSFEVWLPTEPEVLWDTALNGEERSEVFFVGPEGESYSIVSYPQPESSGNQDDDLQRIASELAGPISGEIVGYEIRDRKQVRYADFVVVYPAGEAKVSASISDGEVHVFVMLPPARSPATSQMEETFEKILGSYRTI